MNGMDSLPPSSAPAPQRPWWRHPALGLALMALVVLAVCAVRWRLRDFPLERDEGEYAYMGRLILEGGTPYVEAANMKWPGTWLAYAAIMAVFGQTTAGIHEGLLLVNLASTLLVFLLGRRICGTAGGAVAAGVHAVLSLGTAVLGLAAHANHFVVLCALGGFVVFHGAERPGIGRLFLAGLLFGLAGLMKQAGAVFGLLAFGWLLCRELRATWKSRAWAGAAVRLGGLGCGGLVPLGAAAFWIWRGGAWEPFWWWGVVYAKVYASMVSPAQGWPYAVEVLRSLFDHGPVLAGLAGLGLVGLFFLAEARRWRWWLVLFAAASAAAVCPGWLFRPHYFLLLLPAVALLCGVAVTSGSHLLARCCPRWPLATLPLLAVFAGLAHGLWTDREVFFQLTPAEACRKVYGINPFPESMEIARFLREHTAPEQRLAILGSEPQIYFYADRRSVTPFLYTYPLLEAQPYARAMQQEFAQRIQVADPDYLVLVRVDVSWLATPDGDLWIFDWIAEYQRGFDLVGLVDIYPDRLGEFRWLDRPTPIRPRTDCWVAILRNKRLAPD